MLYMEIVTRGMGKTRAFVKPEAVQETKPWAVTYLDKAWEYPLKVRESQWKTATQ